MDSLQLLSLYAAGSIAHPSSVPNIGMIHLCTVPDKKQIITAAHPSFRDELCKAAFLGHINISRSPRHRNLAGGYLKSHTVKVATPPKRPWNVDGTSKRRTMKLTHCPPDGST